MFPSMSQAPLGLQDTELSDAPDLEIEIENPDSVMLADGSMEITLEAE
jgi:hypothetical protein